MTLYILVDNTTFDNIIQLNFYLKLYEWWISEKVWYLVTPHRFISGIATRRHKHFVVIYMYKKITVHIIKKEIMVLRVN